MNARPLPLSALKGVDDPFWEKVDVRGAADCWEWTASRTRGGYGKVKRNGIHWRASRIAMALVGRDVPTDRLVCHSCDNPPCVNPMHLFLGTDADNAADRKAKGRIPERRGTSNPNCKLTERQVLEIRSSHLSNATLAAEFGVSATSVWNIKNLHTWGNVA